MTKKDYRRAIILKGASEYSKRMCNKQGVKCSECSFDHMKFCHSILEYAKITSDDSSAQKFFKTMSEKEREDYKENLWGEVISSYYRVENT